MMTVQMQVYAEDWMVWLVLLLISLYIISYVLDVYTKILRLRLKNKRDL